MRAGFGQNTEVSRTLHSWHPRRRELFALISGASTQLVTQRPSWAGSILPQGITPAPLPDRHVGVSYSVWHDKKNWLTSPPPNRPWGVPLLGFYRSDDAAVIRQHAEWISNSNIDFINIDWSNDLGVNPAQHKGSRRKQELETNTYKLFEVYVGLNKRPNISIMLGLPCDFGRHPPFAALQAKADQVYRKFVANPRYRPLLQTYLGKPLLIVYLGVHVSPIPPVWQDTRFTVRYMSAYIRQLGPSFYRGHVSTSGYWSWEERGTPTFTVYDGHPEAMTVVASWRGKNTPGRNGGRTFVQNWRFAREVGPRFVMAGTFNEWWIAEQVNPQVSKDIEPSQQYGFRYLDIVKQQSALFKRGV